MREIQSLEYHRNLFAPWNIYRSNLDSVQRGESAGSSVGGFSEISLGLSPGGRDLVIYRLGRARRSYHSNHCATWSNKYQYSCGAAQSVSRTVHESTVVVIRDMGEDELPRTRERKGPCCSLRLTLREGEGPRSTVEATFVRRKRPPPRSQKGWLAGWF
jgi:hypothetical protein